MDVTVVRLPQQQQPTTATSVDDSTTTNFDRFRLRSWIVAPDAGNKRMGLVGGTPAEKERGDNNTNTPDPAALRARLRHRPPTRIDSINTPNSSSSSSYDKVLDTARQVAELTRLRAQDASYIQTLEQTQKTLSNGLHAAGRERAQAEREATSQREEERRREEAMKDEAVRVAERERARAENAERKVRALEEALKSALEKIGVLEAVVERARMVREEWENGLEALALGGVGGGGGGDHDGGVIV